MNNLNLLQFQGNDMIKKLLIINEINDLNGKNQIQELKPDMRLMDDIGLDSLDLAQLTVIIEDRYGVDIFEDEIITTVEQTLEKMKV